MHAGKRILAVFLLTMLLSPGALALGRAVERVICAHEFGDAPQRRGGHRKILRRLLQLGPLDRLVKGIQKQHLKYPSDQDNKRYEDGQISPKLPGHADVAMSTSADAFLLPSHTPSKR